MRSVIRAGFSTFSGEVTPIPFCPVEERRASAELGLAVTGPNYSLVSFSGKAGSSLHGCVDLGWLWLHRSWQWTRALRTSPTDSPCSGHLHSETRVKCILRLYSGYTLHPTGLCKVLLRSVFVYMSYSVLLLRVCWRNDVIRWSACFRITEIYSVCISMPA